jgi:hypothetical protein
MTAMQQWTGCLAVLALAAGLPAALAPARASAWWRRLPRSRWAGRLLSAAALFWAGWLIYEAPLEFLLPYRRWILPATVVAIPLTWLATPDLLACRAFGGLLALLPAPVLLVARSHPSPWRLVVVTSMYLTALAGMLLIMSPYHMRDWIECATRAPARMRLAGLLLTAVALLLAALALTVFAAPHGH